MPFTNEDKVLIKHYVLDERYGAKRLISKFANRNWSLGGLNKLCKKIRDTHSTERKQGSGRPRSARTPENIQIVREEVLSQEDKPGTHSTPDEIAHTLNVSTPSVRRMVKEDLKLKPLKHVKVQRLTAANCMQRQICATRLIRSLTHQKLDKTFFSDEKIFKVVQVYNHQNDRYYVPINAAKKDVNIARMIREKSAFPTQVMVSAAISKLGKTRIIFIPTGLRLNSASYQEEVLSKLITDMRRISGNDYIFQQDGAKCHTSASTIQYLDENVPEYILPSHWPANSCDLNPLDYYVWSRLESIVYRMKIQSLDQLASRVRQAWEQLPQDEINRAIDNFRPRLRALEKANGGHIIKFKL